MGLSCTIFGIKGNICKKNFHTPCKFNAPAEGFLRKFVTALRLKKTGTMSLKMVRNAYDMSIRLDTVYTGSGQTNRKIW